MPEENNNPEQKIFSNQGNTFKTESAARTEITKRGLDKSIHDVKSHEDGFVIIRREPKATKEKFHRVMFNPQQNANDEIDVTLVVNGETLVIKRGVEVIIPDRFKECADHATYPKFTQKPNEVRKQIGTIMVFPYSLLGPATKEDYLKTLAAGNKATKEAIAANDKLVQ